MVVVVSIAFATSVSDEVEVVDVGKATASSHAQCSGEFHLSINHSQCAEKIFLENAKPLNEIFTGLMCMLRGFRICFV